MKRLCILSAIALSIWIQTSIAPAAEGDFASLRREAVKGLDDLKLLTAKAEQRGIDTAHERVTIITAEMFLRFADYDSSHPTQLRDAIGSWWRMKTQADRLSKELPGRELRDIALIVNNAISELETVLERPASHRAPPKIDTSALEINDDGYFHFKGRPTFISSFTWMPNTTELNEAYGNINGVYIAPSQKRSRDKKATISYQPNQTNEPMGNIFLGHSRMPGWAKQEYSGIEIGSRHFTAYDIDHPGTRIIWKALLRDTIPLVAGRNVSQGGYLLANEPHWFSGTGEWATGPVSDFTMQKFRVWLAERHHTIDTLNQLWGKKLGSFDEVKIEVPINTNLRSTPIWYDWCRFNMHRVSDWFAFLREEIKTHDPAAKTHIKLIPSHFASGARSHGLDFETLVRLQEIIGCDAKITNAPTRTDTSDWSKRYACNWRNLSMPYDFFRSVSPEKLIYDSEFHGLSTVHWRDPEMTPEYVRAIYWLAHLHGMGMNQTWYWGRNRDGSPKKNSIEGFVDSNLTQPRVMDAFGRTMKELNAFAPEMVALATQPKRVRLFYSETSAIQDAAYMDRIHETYTALYHQGLPLGFVTGRMIAEASDEDFEEWSVVVIQEANHVTTAELSALSKFLTKGGTVIIFGKESLKSDEYGRTHTASLPSGKGHLLRVLDDETRSIEQIVTPLLATADTLPPVDLKESNPTGKPGCVWRTSPWEKGHLLLVINLGKTKATLQIPEEPASCRDLITNALHPTTFDLEPFGVKLLYLQSTH